MRVFYAFLIIFGAVFLWLLPITTAIYDFRTDLREDAFAVATGAGETSANVVLTKPIYDNDTNTIDILTSLATDNATYSSYNSTSRQLEVGQLVVSENRTLTVTYDIDALVANPSISTLMDILPFMWLICIAVFAPLGLFAVITGRV